MKINIKVMKTDVYTSFQTHFESVYDKIVSNPDDNSWIYYFHNNNDLFETKKYKIDDFELKYSENYEEVELENAIILYEHLHKLPRYILCSNEFWAWIILEKAYKQAQVAMEFKPTVVRNFWFERDNRRSVMLNVMGRQYFKVELSKDDDLVDKYELTKYLFTNHSIYKNFAYRNICMLPNVSRAILNSSYFLYKKYQIKQDETIASDFVKHVTRLGSVQLVDIIPEVELAAYLYKKMDPIVKEKADGKKKEL